jgi:hypothetical protein
LPRGTSIERATLSGDCRSDRANGRAHYVARSQLSNDARLPRLVG